MIVRSITKAKNCLKAKFLSNKVVSDERSKANKKHISLSFLYDTPPCPHKTKCGECLKNHFNNYSSDIHLLILRNRINILKAAYIELCKFEIKNCVFVAR